MKCIRPLEFEYFQTNLSGHTHEAYSAEKLYNVGDTCRIGKRNYKCTKDGTQNKDPLMHEDLWVSEPTNAYAMLDMTNNKPTINENEIHVNFNVLNVDNVYLLGLDAKEVEFTIKKNDEAIAHKKETLSEEIDTLFKYFFSERKNLETKAGTSVKTYGYVNIDIKIKNPKAKAKCTYLVVGRQYDLGISLQKGASTGIKGRTGSTRDTWGNLSLNKGGAFSTVDVPVLINNESYDQLHNFFKASIDEPQLWIGDESGKFKSFTILGKYFDLEMPLSSKSSTYNLRLESISI